jgi:glycine cleavage system H protein
MIESYNIPEDLRYTKEHEWVMRESDEIVVVGITDYAQQSLGDLVYVELPDEGTEVNIGDEMVVVESAKSASEVYAPISGRIVESNDDVDSSPEFVNNSPYEDGWLVKIEMSDPDELDNLLSADGYKHFLEEEGN